MKFSEFFSAPSIRSTAIRLGFFVGFAVVLFSQADWRYAVLAGAGTALLACLVLPIIFYVKLLPYKRIKDALKRPFIVDVPVRFFSQKGTAGGFFVLTEQSIYLLSRECAKERLELSRADVDKIALGEDAGTIDIFLNAKQYIRFFCSGDETIVEILGQHGWNVTR